MENGVPRINGTLPKSNMYPSSTLGLAWNNENCSKAKYMILDANGDSLVAFNNELW